MVQDVAIIGAEITSPSTGELTGLVINMYFSLSLPLSRPRVCAGPLFKKFLHQRQPKQQRILSGSGRVAKASVVAVVVVAVYERR